MEVHRYCVSCTRVLGKSLFPNDDFICTSCVNGTSFCTAPSLSNATTIANTPSQTQATAYCETAPLCGAPAEDEVSVTLIEAAVNGDKSALQRLIAASEDIHGVDDDGYTPLVHAAENGHVDCVQLLLEAKANVHHQISDGQTALHRACRKGHLDVISLLLSIGAELECQDNDGYTPFLYAALCGNAACLRYLLEAGANLHHRSEDGYVPMVLAGDAGDEESALLLLQANGDIHHQTEFGWYPLTTACNNCNIGVARILLEAKADVNAATQDCTPLHISAESGDLDLVNLILQAGPNVNCQDAQGRTALHMACDKGHLPMIEALLEANADVYCSDNEGETPLFGAVASGDLECIKRIIEAGADVSHRTNVGWTPLHIICEIGDAEALQVLLDAKAEPDAKTDKKVTPLLQAAAKGNLDCVRSLIEAGVDINFQGHLGKTALMWIAASGDDELAADMIARGAQKDVLDSSGFSAFYYADDKVIPLLKPPFLDELIEACTLPDAVAKLSELLAKPGVEINRGDKNNNWTPLMEAVLLSTAEVVKLLLDHGAEWTVQGNKGFTAVFWAHLRGDEAIMELAKGQSLSEMEQEAMQRVLTTRNKSPECWELLTWDRKITALSHTNGAQQTASGTIQTKELSIQERMADLTSLDSTTVFYSPTYCPEYSLLQFLLNDEGVKKECQEQDGEHGFDKIINMISEGKKLITMKVAQGNTCAKHHTLVETQAAAGEGKLFACDLCNEMFRSDKVIVHHCGECDYDVCQGCIQVRGNPVDSFALYVYTYESAVYRRSNWAMRCWQKPEAQPVLDIWRPFIYYCDQALDHMTMEKRAVVYRGVAIPFNADLYGIGKEVVWPSFSSTSRALKVATNFARMEPGSAARALVFVICAQSGDSIGECSQYPAEQEILFRPNLRLKVFWLGRSSMLSDAKELIKHPTEIRKQLKEELEPFILTNETALQENVVVIFCEEIVSEDDK